MAKRAAPKLSPELVDEETRRRLRQLEAGEKIKNNIIPGVRTVLVVTSAAGVVFDVEAIRQKVLHFYPGSAIFFRTTNGKPLGVPSPKAVDMLIDLTGPGQRQGWFYARKLRRMARFVVGRNAGLFRKRIYDRVFDEKVIWDELPESRLDRERFVQKHVLELVGVSMAPIADVTPDLAKTIALDLPPLAE